MDYISIYNGSSKKGCWIRLRRLARHLAKNGDRVFIIVPAHYEGLEHENVFPVVLNSPNRYRYGIRKVLWSIVACLAAFRISSRLNIFTYIAFDTHNGLPLLLASWINKSKPRVLFIRGDANYQSRFNEPPIYGLFMRVIDKLVKNSSSDIICNNDAAVSCLKDKATINNIYLLENDSAIVPRCRIKRSSDENKFIVGYCGQFSRRKNIQHLIAAFLNLPSNEYELVLYGNWNDHKWSRDIKRSLPQNILMNDWAESLHTFYESIDLFVLPSLFDDFSNAALDAIAYGIPVLLSGTGGSPQMVRWNELFLFDPNSSPESLAARIVSVKNQYNALCKKIGSLSHEYYFDWENSAYSMLRQLGEPASEERSIDITSIPKLIRNA